MPTFEEVIKESIYSTPLVLLGIKDNRLRETATSYLPYSTGFEIECHKGELYDLKAFTSIPGIMEVNNSEYEQRYRIPHGLNGILCLYCISIQLKLNSELNPGSGIHYNVDMTGYSERINNEFLQNNADWILNELDSWEYQGKYNERKVVYGKGGWMGSRFDRMEFRLGEMTFDYPLLVKRIIHCNDIVRRLKAQLPVYAPIQSETKEITQELIKYITNIAKSRVLQDRLSAVEEKIRVLSLPVGGVDSPLDMEEVKNTVNSRIIKI